MEKNIFVFTNLQLKSSNSFSCEYKELSQLSVAGERTIASQHLKTTMIYAHDLWVGWAVLLASSSGSVQLVATLGDGLTPMCGGWVLVNVLSLGFLTWLPGSKRANSNV